VFRKERETSLGRDRILPRYREAINRGFLDDDDDDDDDASSFAALVTYFLRLQRARDDVAERRDATGS